MSDNNGHAGRLQGRSIANADLLKSSRAHAAVTELNGLIELNRFNEVQE
jgi:hypothetical protein